MKIRQALKLLGRTKHRSYKTVELWPPHCMMGTQGVSKPRTKKKIKTAEQRVRRWQRKFVTIKGSNPFAEFYSALPRLENTFSLHAFDPYASTKAYIGRLRGAQ